MNVYCLRYHTFSRSRAHMRTMVAFLSVLFSIWQLKLWKRSNYLYILCSSVHSYSPRKLFTCFYNAFSCKNRIVGRDPLHDWLGNCACDFVYSSFFNLDREPYYWIRLRAHEKLPILIDFCQHHCKGQERSSIPHLVLKPCCIYSKLKLHTWSNLFRARSSTSRQCIVSCFK